MYYCISYIRNIDVPAIAMLGKPGGYSNPRNLQQDPRSTDPEKTRVSNSLDHNFLGRVRWDSVPFNFWWNQRFLLVDGWLIQTIWKKYFWTINSIWNKVWWIQTTRWEISPHPKPGAVFFFLTIPSLNSGLQPVTSVRLAGEVVDVDSEYRKPLDLVRQFSNGKWAMKKTPGPCWSVYIIYYILMGVSKN